MNLFPEIIRWEGGSTVIELRDDEVSILDDHGTRLADYQGHYGRDFELVWSRKAGGATPKHFASIEVLLEYHGIKSATIEAHKALVRALVDLARGANHDLVSSKKAGNSEAVAYASGRVRGYMLAARECRKELLHTHNLDKDGISLRERRSIASF